MREVVVPQDPRQSGEEPVHGRRHDGRPQKRVQLLMQRSRTFRESHELRDPRQLRRSVAVVEAARKLLGERADVRAEQRDEAAREQRLGDLLEMLLVRRRFDRPWARQLVVQDLALQLSQLPARFEALVEQLSARVRAVATGRSKRLRSMDAGSTASRYPGARNWRRSAPSTRRSAPIVFCNEVATVRGGCSPQTASTRKSVDTTWFARKSRSTSTARACFPARASGSPSSPRTSRGPRIRNSSTDGLYLPNRPITRVSSAAVSGL